METEWSASLEARFAVFATEWRTSGLVWRTLFLTKVRIFLMQNLAWAMPADLLETSTGPLPAGPEALPGHM